MDATSSYLNRNRLSALEQQMQEALEKLLNLTVFELEGNTERQPWKRNIERAREALAAADRAASSSTEE